MKYTDKRRNKKKDTTNDSGEVEINIRMVVGIYLVHRNKLGHTSQLTGFP